MRVVPVPRNVPQSRSSLGKVLSTPCLANHSSSSLVSKSQVMPPCSPHWCPSRALEGLHTLGALQMWRETLTAAFFPLLPPHWKRRCFTNFSVHLSLSGHVLIALTYSTFNWLLQKCSSLQTGLCFANISLSGIVRTQNAGVYLLSISFTYGSYWAVDDNWNCTDSVPCLRCRVPCSFSFCWGAAGDIICSQSLCNCLLGTSGG